MSEPHEGQPLLGAGANLEEAELAMVMLHGRGATARDILSLVPVLERPGWSFLAPQAANGTWYPDTFRAPVERNEPWLSSALGVIDGLLERVRVAGIGPDRTILLGFSQGGCLALEYAARNPRRYGGLAGLSAALIGPDGGSPRQGGSLAGTPVFLGCDDADPHIPSYRVSEAAEDLRRLGGEVRVELYHGLGHTVSQAEIDHVAEFMRRLPARSG